MQTSSQGKEHYSKFISTNKVFVYISCSVELDIYKIIFHLDLSTFFVRLELFSGQENLVDDVLKGGEGKRGEGKEESG